jgi:8-oxo-dGTP diphosphatase
MSGSSRAPKNQTGKKTVQVGKETSPAGLVRAAGGVVWRRVPAGVEVVLVHRPAYDDWAIPKGKLEPGETDEEAAQREVREETGLSCRLGAELPSTTYADAQGRPKIVRYWSMTVIPGTGTGGVGPPGGGPGAGTGDAPLAPEPKARKEIDDLCWELLPEARARLTYARDVVVLDALSGFLSSSDVRRQKVD